MKFRFAFAWSALALTAATSACSGSAMVPPGSAVHAARVAPHAKSSGNLIVNGDAELGDATLTGYDSVTIPGWNESGLPTVVAYGAVSGFPQKSSPGAGGGRNYFTGGPFSSSTLWQKIDVSSAASAIDAGRVTCTLAGLLGGYLGVRDDARLSALFRSASGARIGSVTIGPVTNHDRGGLTGFVRRSATPNVPKGTRSIDVVLHFTMYQRFVADFSRDDGFADDLSLVLSTPLTPSPSPSPTPPPPPPKFDHIFFVYFENSNYDQIVGNTKQAPFINAMARRYSLLGNYYALHHPSDANYVLQAAGGTYGLHQNDFAGFTITATHLADLVERAGGTWKQYMQSAHFACDQTQHGYYYPDDGPYMYFSDVRLNTKRCDDHVVPFKRFARDLASDATTPRYAWLSPDDCSDMESCGITAGDNFLKNEIVKPLFASPAWTQHDTLLIVSWDEDDFTPVNHIPGIFISRSHVKNGYVSHVLYTHYSILKTIEASLGLPNLTKNDRYAASINDIWR